MTDKLEQQSLVLRKFHNFVKLKLYQKYAKKSSILLDIGTGRGGDMLKWHKNNIQSVIALDINNVYISEAMSRYNYNQQLKQRDYKFFHCNSKHIFLNFLQIKHLPILFDSISCMFALHYFFNNTENIKQLLSQISSSLKPGGYFFGTCLDGNKIHSILEKSSTYKSNSMYIERNYSEKQNTGNNIQFMLSGTLYFGETIT